MVAQHNKLMQASGMSVFGCSVCNAIVRRSAAVDKARAWLERTSRRRRRSAAGLPYGAQRRLEIARAMCTDPALVPRRTGRRLNPRESTELNALLSRLRAGPDRRTADRAHMSVVMQISTTSWCSTTAAKIARAATGDPARSAVIAAYLVPTRRANQA